MEIEMRLKRGKDEIYGNNESSDPCQEGGSSPVPFPNFNGFGSGAHHQADQMREGYFRVRLSFV
jgi:hypothetical protein